jgi:hypothetical protein
MPALTDRPGGVTPIINADFNAHDTSHGHDVNGIERTMSGTRADWKIVRT